MCQHELVQQLRQPDMLGLPQKVQQANPVSELQKFEVDIPQHFCKPTHLIDENDMQKQLRPRNHVRRPEVPRLDMPSKGSHLQVVQVQNEAHKLPEAPAG